VVQTAKPHFLQWWRFLSPVNPLKLHSQNEHTVSLFSRTDQSLFVNTGQSLGRNSRPSSIFLFSTSYCASFLSLFPLINLLLIRLPTIEPFNLSAVTRLVWDRWKVAMSFCLTYPTIVPPSLWLGYNDSYLLYKTDLLDLLDLLDTLLPTLLFWGCKIL